MWQLEHRLERLLFELGAGEAPADSTERATFTDIVGPAVEEIRGGFVPS